VRSGHLTNAQLPAKLPSLLTSTSSENGWRKSPPRGA
jgi:hypothetical protein